MRASTGSGQRGPAPNLEGATIKQPDLGLRANAPQFTLLVAVTALVGGTSGQERTVPPLLATDVFGLDLQSARCWRG